MSLYGGIRARSFFRHHSRQLVNRIIAEEVLYYKLSLSETRYNMYGESKNKMYNQPILIACLHTLTGQEPAADTYGTSISQDTEFRFLRDDLVDLNLVTEIGDIICWQESYYEVTLVVETQFIMGKVPEFSLESDLQKYGESWSMVCRTHLTAGNKLNITKST